MIAILVSLFYFVCVLSLKKYVSKEDINPDTLTRPTVIISAILITYIVFSVTELVFPKLSESIWYVVLAIVSMLSFSIMNFIIYVSDRYEKSLYLFITACSALIADTLLTLNEMYYYSRVFTILINITETLGLYFFVSFFVETKLIVRASQKNDLL
ncbi:hypothetical protein FHK87_22000 [Aquimarina algicola]|uniref:Uncharacterized protein n=1 Tax=Aquimarina algicola TaxID=2589995 RepID=A0A504J3E6_9FLAO|nr:hypothetical protein FHK87_22000 [Aquimarina algicola]